MPAVPAIYFPTVDVRDVAEAHLKGVLLDEANGKRFILVASNHWAVEFAQMFKESKKYDNYATHTIQGDVDTTQPFSYEFNCLNSSSKEILGIDYIPISKSLVDMGQSLIETGYIPSGGLYA